MLFFSQEAQRNVAACWQTTALLSHKAHGTNGGQLLWELNYCLLVNTAESKKSSILTNLPEKDKTWRADYRLHFNHAAFVAMSSSLNAGTSV